MIKGNKNVIEIFLNTKKQFILNLMKENQWHILIKILKKYGGGYLKCSKAICKKEKKHSKDYY